MSDEPNEQEPTLAPVEEPDQRAEKPTEDQPTEEPTRTEVDERMDRIYPNRHMTAEERPPIPEGGIEPSPEDEPTS